MKLITAIIEPRRLESVAEALSEIDITSFSAYDVRNYGQSQTHTEMARGVAYTVRFETKSQIEVLVEDAHAEAAAATITKAAQTAGASGIVWMCEATEMGRITGE